MHRRKKNSVGAISKQFHCCELTIETKYFLTLTLSDMWTGESLVLQKPLFIKSEWKIKFEKYIFC